MNDLKKVVGKFVTRTKDPESTEILDQMSALDRIEWMRIHNPNAKLIPFSPTYHKAVREMNMRVSGSKRRPPVPDWFCGSVNDQGWPWLDDSGNIGDATDLYNLTKIGDEDKNAGMYPWDRCCEYGMEPNTPGYMWCEEPVLYAVNEDDSFLSDFSMDDVYADATFPEKENGESEYDGECNDVEQLPSKSGEWSCGGWGGGQIGKADVKIGTASISGRNRVSWSYTKGASLVDAWGTSNTILCLGLYAEGNWYSGKIDFVKPGQTVKDLTNVKCGYKGWTHGALNKANKGKICVCNAKSKACSNWCEFSV